MTITVTVALISAGAGVVSGLFTLIGVVYSNKLSNDARDAVIDEKLEALTREVREHNEFAKRIPLVEKDVNNLFHRYEELIEWKNKLP